MHCGTKMKKDGNASARRENKYKGGMARNSYKKGGQPMYKHGECPKGKPC